LKLIWTKSEHFLGLVEQVWRLKRLKALRIVWSGNLPKLYFWQKIMLQLVPFRISFRRSKIELRKSTSFKSSKNCQFQHIFNRKCHSSHFRKTENRNYVVNHFVFINCKISKFSFGPCYLYITANFRITVKIM